MLPKELSRFENPSWQGSADTRIMEWRQPLEEGNVAKTKIQTGKEEG